LETPSTVGSGLTISESHEPDENESCCTVPACAVVCGPVITATKEQATNSAVPANPRPPRQSYQQLIGGTAHPYPTSLFHGLSSYYDTHRLPVGLRPCNSGATTSEFGAGETAFCRETDRPYLGSMRPTSAGSRKWPPNALLRVCFFRTPTTCCGSVYFPFPDCMDIRQRET